MSIFSKLFGGSNTPNTNLIEFKVSDNALARAEKILRSAGVKSNASALDGALRAVEIYAWLDSGEKSNKTKSKSDSKKTGSAKTPSKRTTKTNKKAAAEKKPAEKIVLVEKKADSKAVTKPSTKKVKTKSTKNTSNSKSNTEKEPVAKPVTTVTKKPTVPQVKKAAKLPSATVESPVPTSPVVGETK